MANFWDGSNAEVLDQDGNVVGSTDYSGGGAPPGAETGDGPWNHYGQPQIVNDPPDRWRGPGTRSPQPVAGNGVDPNNPYGLQTGTFTGGGDYPLASVMGSGWMQPWTTPFSYGGFNGDAYQFKAPTATDMTQDPSFEFRMSEGSKALQRGAAARGTLLTGGAQRDLASWAQDYASQEYSNVYQRKLGENQMGYGRALGEYQQGYGNAANQYSQAYNIWANNQNTQFNRAQAIKGGGQTAVNQLGSLGSAYANNAGNIQMGIGNAQAAATVGTANAWNNAASNVSQMGMGYLYSQPSTRSTYAPIQGTPQYNQPGWDYSPPAAPRGSISQ